LAAPLIHLGRERLSPVLEFVMDGYVERFTFASSFQHPSDRPERVNGAECTGLR
jgi:hypothetical protein